MKNSASSGAIRQKRKTSSDVLASKTWDWTVLLAASPLIMERSIFARETFIRWISPGSHTIDSAAEASGARTRERKLSLRTGQGASECQSWSADIHPLLEARILASHSGAFLLCGEKRAPKCRNTVGDLPGLMHRCACLAAAREGRTLRVCNLVLFCA